MPDSPEIVSTEPASRPEIPDTVAEVIRVDLIRTLQQQPLTPALCTRLGRMLEAAERFLRAQGEDLEGVLGGRLRGEGIYGEYIASNAIAPSSSRENFGSTIARELLSGLRALAPGRDPAKLTEALATARQNGMQIADQIEESLKAALATSLAAADDGQSAPVEGSPAGDNADTGAPSMIPIAALPGEAA